MAVEALEKWIAEMMPTLVARNEYLDDDETFARMKTIQSDAIQSGSWLWIQVSATCSYDTEAPWYDYTSWTRIERQYSWIGPADTVPEMKPAALDEWATRQTHYHREWEKADLQVTQEHKGEIVERIDEDQLVLRRANGVGKADGNTEYRFETETQALTKPSH